MGRRKGWMVAALVAAAGLVSAAEAPPAGPAKVMVVGTYHFENPGADLHNVAATDVMTPGRQAELQSVMFGLAAFEPTRVAVEWPADAATTAYAGYVAGTTPPRANEVVQLGFRLARAFGHDTVLGLDVPGDFPFEDVQAWAQANGKAAELDALLAEVGGIVDAITARQETQSIGQVLRAMNTPEANASARDFYAAMLRFGAGAQQPGVALVAAWERRNLAICANLLQALAPGDRVVVFYGQGHAYLLQRCIEESPGVELVQANDYLPDQPRIAGTPPAGG